VLISFIPSVEDTQHRSVAIAATNTPDNNIIYLTPLMFSEIIPTKMLTENDRKIVMEFHRKRNLYNKYTLEELNNWLCVDLYEALDLDSYRETEIPESILSYTVKRKSGMYHPTNNKGKQHAFLIIKKAETVLSNSRLRKVYDSCFLDESLPEDREYDSTEFFQTFSSVFKRNGLFSETKPVPNIEDDPEVFYGFWQSFKTTRIYDDPADVFDVSGSMRRFSADKKKEQIQQRRMRDLQRVQELVKLAIKRDPRTKKKKESSAWDEAQVKSLKRLDGLFGKAPNKVEVITKKLNELFLTKRSTGEVKAKIDELKK